MGRARIHKPSIFQGQLQFPASRASFTFHAEHQLERTAFRALSAVLLILVLAYLYFVVVSVLNVIARKEAMSRSTQLSSTIGAYERDYFAISDKVKPDAGVPLGLYPASNVAYVYRPGVVGQALTTHNEI
ncbi:MAG: hypothetical protein Q7S05_05295 [bacterium]|nr:hypothetical protein [bacterium]